MISKKQQQQWQAESDAHTLAEYQQILSDKTRMSRAIKEAEKQAHDMQQRANAMQKASRVSSGRTSSRKK